MRVCKAPVAGGLAREPSEPAAKKRAIEDWTRRAKAAGVTSPVWRTAANKVLKCAPIGTATFECVAYGAPCTVQQVPPRRPSEGGGGGRGGGGGGGGEGGGEGKEGGGRGGGGGEGGGGGARERPADRGVTGTRVTGRQFR